MSKVSQEVYRAQQSKDLLALCRKFAAPTFVEVGVGAHPNVPRLRSIVEHGGTYIGFDLVQVCERHKHILATQKVAVSNIKYIGNARGSYVYTLVNWFRSGGQADVIFLDGHHTMYVDLPAAYVCWCALKPGGYLVLDDTNWTLATVASNMHRDFDSWKFYSQLYDFSVYEPAEMREAHIGVVRDVFLVGVHKMELQPMGYDGYSVLRKIV